MTDYKCQEIDNIKNLTDSFIKVAESFIELKKEQENIVDTLGSDWKEKQFCACGNYKMDESDFCKDCI